MGVKNNFSQAVSELIGISRNVEPEDRKEATEVPAEEMPDTEAIDETAGKEAGAAGEMENAERETEMTADQKEGTTHTVQNPKERIMAMLAAQQAQQQSQTQTQQSQTQTQESQTQSPEMETETQDQETQAQSPETETQTQQNETNRNEPANPPVPQFELSERPRIEDAGVTTIAKGTVIIGEINADGDVELLGSVKGKIASQGDIKANGKVIGDLIGRDIDLVACAVQGNIIASGMVTVDGSSVVIGDVKGENFCLDGKIKGNVTVEKEAKFQPQAILAGNVTTASIAMSQGAKIQGAVNIPLSEKETDMTFDIDMKI